jgi:tRNA 2-selenouridine synthase
VTIAQMDEFDEIIDVRSPSEYALDHIPGAINLPVLDDDERARVGTLYKQVSQFDARKLGAALVAKNVARHLERHFAGRDHRWKPLVYCWRGGKRSGSMAHILREVGWHAATLDGGYRSYRRDVLSSLETLPKQFRFRVVCGATGSAKSRLLEALMNRGAQVLDLEGLAKHRGSVLGSLPGSPQPSQKMFDSLIWNTLRGLDPAQTVYVEAESRKIGQLQVPETLLECMRAANCVAVEAPVAERVQFLIHEYRHFLTEPAWLKAQLLRLTALHSKETVDKWLKAIDESQWETLVADLLELHYDPAYRKSTSNNYPALRNALRLNATRLDHAGVDELAATLLSAQD